MKISAPAPAKNPGSGNPAKLSVNAKQEFFPPLQDNTRKCKLAYSLNLRVQHSF